LITAKSLNVLVGVYFSSVHIITFVPFVSEPECCSSLLVAMVTRRITCNLSPPLPVLSLSKPQNIQNTLQ